MKTLGTAASSGSLILFCLGMLMAYAPPEAAQAQSPLQEVTTAFEYDGNGNIVARVDGNGGRTLYTYDKLNRLTAIDYPDGTAPDVQFTYDGNSNLTRMTDWTGTTQYSYDIFDRLSAVDYPDGNVIMYGYDAAGNVIWIACGTRGEEGAICKYALIEEIGLCVYHLVQYEYDPDGRISSVTDGLTGETTTYVYDKAGSLSRCDLPNGCYTLYGYDADGRLVTVEHRNAGDGLITKYEYTLNSIGNRTKVVETTVSNSRETTYAYDLFDRLKTATYPDGRKVEYEHDSFGNRTKMTETRGGATTVTEYTYDSDSRLLSTRVNGVEDERFSYDAIGNLAKRVSVRPGSNRQVEYAYDNENRLVRYADGTNTVTYTYDGLGNRIGKTTNGQETRFLNDTNRIYTEAIAELDTSNMPIRLRGLGTDLLSVRPPFSDSLFYLHDTPGGSVRQLVDRSGQVVNDYRYDAFGAVTAEVTGIADSYMFHGESQESETDLLFLKARYYDPSTGRFLTRNPIQGMFHYLSVVSPYVFAGQNPVDKTNPMGTIERSLTEDLGHYIYDKIRGKLLEAAIEAAENRPAIAAIGPWVEKMDTGFAVLDAFLNYLEVAGKFIRGQATQFDLIHATAMIPGSLVPGVAMFDILTYHVPHQYALALELSETPRDFRTDPIIEAGVLDPLFDRDWRRLRYPPLPPGGGGGAAAVRPGGVDLNRTAEVISEIRDIKGVAYDRATGQLVIYGEKNAALPPVNFDDFIVAARAIFRGFDPVVSIDPPEVSCPANGCNNGSCQTVRYGDPVLDPDTGEPVIQDLSSGTHFGWVMFEADRMLKCLSLGKDNVTCQPVVCNVPGYKSLFTRIREAGGIQGNITVRFWFRPGMIRVTPSPDGKSMMFSEAGMELLTETKYTSGGQEAAHPAVEEFAAHFNDHFDEFAAAFPVFEDLRQLAKIVGIVKWIRDSDIPFDLSLLEKYTPAHWDTPLVTPVTSMTLEWTDGLTIHTLTQTGGVTCEGDLQLTPPVAGSENAVLVSRPAETDQTWTLNHAGTEYVATAVCLEKQPMQGGFVWADTDLTARINGSMPLALTRFYDSFDVEDGPLGWGWRIAPYELQYKGTTAQFELDAHKQTGYYQVTFVDRTTGSVYDFEPGYFYDSQADIWQLKSVFDAQEDVLLYTYNTSCVPGGLLSDGTDRFVMRLADGSLLSFDAQGRLLYVSDRNNNQVVYTYDQSGKLVSIGQPACGRVITPSYDGNGRVVSATGPGGTVVSYSYDASGNLVQVATGASGTAQAAGHASDGLVRALQETTDDESIRYVYDKNHLLTEIQNGEGQPLLTQKYDAYGRVVSTGQTADATGFAVDYSIADSTIMMSGPDDFFEVREYDANHNLICWTDARGNATNFSYNSVQNLTAVTDAQGHTTGFYYDSNGYLLAVCLPNGRFDAVDRDEQERPIRSFQTFVGDGYEKAFNDEHVQIRSASYTVYNVAEHQYDGAGHLVQIKDSRGNTSTFAYDVAGNVIEARDGRGQSTSYRYDGYSRMVEATDAEGHAISFEYDGLDNLTGIGMEASGIALAYDSQGRLSLVTYGDLQEPRSYKYGYNAINQLTTVTGPDGTVSTYTYDSRGNLVGVTHDGILRVEYEYDGLNRVRQIRYWGTADAAIVN